MSVSINFNKILCFLRDAQFSAFVTKIDLILISAENLSVEL